MYSSKTQLPSRRAGKTGLRQILETLALIVLKNVELHVLSVLAPCEAVKGTLCSLTVQPPRILKPEALQ